MTEEKKEMLKLQGFYMGKEFVKKGEKNGKAWSMSKLLIKTKMDDQFAKKITMFDGLKGFEEITDGDFVSVGYVLSDPFEITTDKGAKKMIQSKTALWVGKSDESEATTEQPAVPRANVPHKSANKPHLKDFDAFSTKYLELVKGAKMEPNAVHMMGSYINTTEKERVAELLAKCKEATK